MNNGNSNSKSIFNVKLMMYVGGIHINRIKQCRHGNEKNTEKL